MITWRMYVHQNERGVVQILPCIFANVPPSYHNGHNLSICQHKILIFRKYIRGMKSVIGIILICKIFFDESEESIIRFVNVVDKYKRALKNKFVISFTSMIIAPAVFPSFPFRLLIYFLMRLLQHWTTFIKNNVIYYNKKSKQYNHFSTYLDDLFAA